MAREWPSLDLYGLPKSLHHSGVPAPVGRPLPPLRTWNDWRVLPMPRFFRLEVEENDLTDALFAFVVHPTPSRNELPVIQELHDFAPEMVPVLENMILDGVG